MKNRKPVSNNDNVNDLNNITFNSSGKVIKTVHGSSADFTFGTSSDQFNQGLEYFYSLPNNIDVFSKIRSNIESIPKENVRKSVLDFVFKFQTTLMSINNISEIKNYLPPLTLNNSPDGVLLEWIFKDFRLGFFFDIDNNDSSWYLAVVKGLEEANKAGALKESELDLLLNMLIKFVLRNS